ncbi:hypothetical protein Gotri_014565, partial [Gossypium trilobum]|nr:hypothetical protein [Gossypium trilobum]
MAVAAAPDHLFHLRNNFYLGSFQLVINEIDSAAATPLQAVKLLALYLSNPHDKESTIASLKEWLADPAIGSNAILRLIAGIVFMHEEDYIEALKHTNAGGTMELRLCNWQFIPFPQYTSSLIGWDAALDWLTVNISNLYIQKQIGTSDSSVEFLFSIFSHALNVQIFIKMHRSDYAERQLRVMQQIDEDHTLTQLANAWLNLAVGGSKIQEAYLIFQDFSEKYPMTGLILNGKADAKDPETLANLVVCGLHLGKSSSRYL